MKCVGGNPIVVHDLEAAIYGTVGDMLPAYVEDGGDLLRPPPTICGGRTESGVSQLRDRGTQRADGVVTNAQDLMHVTRSYVERWEQEAGQRAARA